jgi:hypothetical protein
LNVKHGGVDIRMTHEVHQGRQRDAGAHHIGAKGVSKPVRVGLQDLALPTVMAEEGA